MAIWMWRLLYGFWRFAQQNGNPVLIAHGHGPLPHVFGILRELRLEPAAAKTQDADSLHEPRPSNWTPTNQSAQPTSKLSPSITNSKLCSDPSITNPNHSQHQQTKSIEIRFSKLLQATFPPRSESKASSPNALAPSRPYHNDLSEATKNWHGSSLDPQFGNKNDGEKVFLSSLAILEIFLMIHESWPSRLTVAGEATARSFTSNITVMLGGNLMRSPLDKHNILCGRLVDWASRCFSTLSPKETKDRERSGGPKPQITPHNEPKICPEQNVENHLFNAWRTPLFLEQSVLLSSKTVFMFSIQMASTGPSKFTHFLSSTRSAKPYAFGVASLGEETRVFRVYDVHRRKEFSFLPIISALFHASLPLCPFCIYMRYAILYIISSFILTKHSSQTLFGLRISLKIELTTFRSRSICSHRSYDYRFQTLRPRLVVWSIAHSLSHQDRHQAVLPEASSGFETRKPIDGSVDWKSKEETDHVWLNEKNMKK